MNKTISVIIPVYNVEKYIDKCIKSVINQSYTNLEIILVDDGSKDRSGEICDEYSRLDNRVKVIHKENGGLSDARNAGIDIATGEYIAFLDSDDWADENLYKTLYFDLLENNADISICSFKKVYSENERLNGIEVSGIKYTNTDALKAMYKDECVNMVIAWNKLYKRKLFNKKRFPFGKIHEDEFLIPELLYSSKSIFLNKRELIYYRQTEGSIMNSKYSIGRLDYLEALYNRSVHFLENNERELYLANIRLEKYATMDSIVRVMNSDIENKKLIIKKLYSRLREIKNDGLLFNDKIKISIFYMCPSVYKKLFLNY